MPIINCPDCGKPVSDKAKVCIHCGRPLSSAQHPINPRNQYQQSPLPYGGAAQSNNNLLKGIIVVLAVAVVAISVVIGIMLYNGRGASGSSNIEPTVVRVVDTVYKEAPAVTEEPVKKEEPKTKPVPKDDGVVYKKTYSNDQYFIHHGSFPTIDEARSHMMYDNEEICRVYIPSGKRKGTHYRIMVGPYYSENDAYEDAYDLYYGSAYEVLTGKKVRQFSPVFMY